MDRKLISRRIGSILDDISRLSNALYAMDTTDIDVYKRQGAGFASGGLAGVIGRKVTNNAVKTATTPSETKASGLGGLVGGAAAVSYTHLAVYKRQVLGS